MTNEIMNNNEFFIIMNFFYNANTTVNDDN